MDLQADIDKRSAGGGVALVFIHGILGSPEFFDFLIPYVPEDWTVCSLTLKGQCGTVRDFGAASMSDWKKQVKSVVGCLHLAHRRVVVVAHSMGTLFAIREAVEGRVDALFLMNVPLALHATRRLFMTPMKIFTGNIDLSDKWTAAAVKAYGISDDRNILHYLPWIARYMELFGEIRRTRRLAARLDVPAMAYFSRHDEMVSLSAAKYLSCSHGLTVKVLSESGHYYYADEDKNTLILDFRDFCKTQAFSI